MTTFYQFINDQALRDKLPFTIDFEIRPVDKLDAVATKQIGRFEFPVMDSLLPREMWFFEAIDELSGVNAAQARLEQIILSMTQELMVACKIESVTDALQYVYQTPEEVQSHPNFEKYLESTQGLRDELIKLSKQVSNDSYSWLKVTFFMLSRVDANWDVSMTSAMPPKILEAIIDLIDSENNGATTTEPTEEEFVATQAELPSGK